MLPGFIYFSIFQEYKHRYLFLFFSVTVKIILFFNKKSLFFEKTVILMFKYGF